MNTKNPKSTTKTEILRFRASESTKEAIENFAAKHNTNMSALLTASIQATLSAYAGSGQDSKMAKKKREKEMALRHQYLVENNLRMNHVRNLIVNDPTIPDETKEKLIKEMTGNGRF